MNPDFQNFARNMAGGLGESLFTEIANASWDQPKNQYIEELGISYGHHQGLVRKRNEDRLIVAKISSANGETYILAAICDGVGGSECGNIAAEITLATITSEITYLKTKLPASELIRHAIRRADEKVRLSLNGKGLTTLSLVLATSAGEFISANIGDSRVFTWEGSESKQIKQISIDDTLENELKNLQIADATALKQKGLLGSLSQAIGETGRTSSDLFIRVQQSHEFDSKIMIASDGAWKNSNDAFMQVALNSKVPTETAKRILVVANWTGGTDNSSVIVIESKENLISQCKNQPPTDRPKISVKYWFAENIFSYSELLIPIYSPSAPPQAKTTKKQSKRSRPKNLKEDRQSELTGLSENKSNDKKLADRPMVQIIVDEDNNN